VRVWLEFAGGIYTLRGEVYGANAAIAYSHEIGEEKPTCDSLNGMTLTWVSTTGTKASVCDAGSSTVTIAVIDGAAGCQSTATCATPANQCTLCDNNITPQAVLLEWPSLDFEIDINCDGVQQWRPYTSQAGSAVLWHRAFGVTCQWGFGETCSPRICTDIWCRNFRFNVSDSGQYLTGTVLQVWIGIFVSNGVCTIAYESPFDALSLGCNQSKRVCFDPASFDVTFQAIRNQSFGDVRLVTEAPGPAHISLIT
jgi:hypothetical protein